MADEPADRTVAADAVPDGVAFVLDGGDCVARPGELLIDAAERAGTYIPRFCYHARLSPVGMCRMCLVEVDTGRGATLQPSCMLPVTPGMVVDTSSERVVKAQDGVLEFLLLNHPLDCPVCDKGGECPLQDHTVAFGPGESRYLEEKRHNAKPVPISPLVLLDRERCILCDRCTRVAKDVAGDPLIHFIHRGNRTEVNTFPDHPFASYFSGNTVQVCPVGALTATSYRFKARPWDLESTESTCTTCAVGCRVALESSRDELVRVQGVDVDPVNWGWLCDKGRFGFAAASSPARLREPLVSGAGGLAPARWSDAIDQAAGRIRQSLERGGPASIGVIGGARLTNEAAYAWTKLAKGILGTDNVDAQLGDGLPAELVAGVPRATIDEACRPGGTVVLLAPDLKETLPVLYLRFRHAAQRDGVRLIELAARRSALSPLADATLLHRPGEAADVMRSLVGGEPMGKDAGGVDRDALAAARSLLATADGPVTLVLGRPSVAESPAWIADAASVLLDARSDVRVLSALRRGNVHGAIDAGMAPGLLPGRVALGGAASVEAVWPTSPGETGLDTAGMLAAAASGQLDTLVVVGADPLTDFPDRALVERALAGVGSLIVIGTVFDELAQRAHVVLPAAGHGEVDGTVTNLEGRVTTVCQRVTPPGTARADWIIAADLARAMGASLAVRSVADLRAEHERVSPSHRGVSDALFTPAGRRDGVVTPVDGAVPLRWTSPEPQPLVPLDSYAIRLVATRRLYDRGTTVQHSASLADLVPGTSLTMNPYDFDRLGVASGSVVVLTAPRSDGTTVRVRVTASPDDGVPRGAGALDVLQPTLDVHALLEAGTLVTPVRIDSGSAE